MNSKHRSSLVLALLMIAASSLAAADSRAVSSACATLEFMAKMVAVNTVLPANYDSPH